MGLVVLVSPDLEECSILRQWVCEFSSRGSIHNFNKLKKLPRNIVNEPKKQRSDPDFVWNTCEGHVADLLGCRRK